MDAVVKETLCSAGINVDSALERFMGNDNLLIKFLKKFAADENYEKLVKAVEQKDREAALAASHTLKGISGNLAMDRLFELCKTQVDLYRADKPDEADALISEITAEYGKITSVLASCGMI